MIYGTLVCFQPPSLLIRKVWVPVMHFCVCHIYYRVHWRMGSRPGLCRSTSALLLIGSTIREFSISSALWVLEVLCCLYWHSSYLIDHTSMFWWMDVAVNWSTLCHCATEQCFGPIVVLYTSELFSILDNKLIGYADDSTFMAVVPSPGVWVTVAESLNRDLVRVNAWCDLWGMKLNASKTKTMIVSGHAQCIPSHPH